MPSSPDVAGETLNWFPTGTVDLVHDLVSPTGKVIRLGLPEKKAGRKVVSAPELPQAGVYRMLTSPRGAEPSDTVDPGTAEEHGAPIAVIYDAKEIENLSTLSDGEKIKNPRFFKRDAHGLAKAQRRLEKVEKGTPTRTKRKKVIARIHERIVHKRTDFAHKLSRQWVNTYGVIVLEDLNIVGMMEEHKVIFGNKLNKSIADVAWSQLAEFTAYKAEDAGRLFLQVDPRNTSKMCSRCRSLVPKTLADRVHNCPHCGLVLDRDHNAAINILALGLQRIGNQSVEAQVL